MLLVRVSLRRRGGGITEDGGSSREDRLLGAGEGEEIAGAEPLARLREQDRLPAARDGEHGGAGATTEIELGERLIDARAPIADPYRDRRAEAGEQAVHLVERRVSAGRGSPLAQAGQRFDHGLGSGPHVALEIAGIAPDRDREPGDEDREDEGARIAREKLLGHGEDGDDRKQCDPELHRHHQGPARRRIEIHLSGAARDCALGQGLPESACKPAETEEKGQRHGDRGSDHDDPRRRRADPDHAHDGADHRVEIEPHADDEPGEQRHVQDEEAQPVSEAGRRRVPELVCTLSNQVP